jgi:hypothetical protein
MMRRAIVGILGIVTALTLTTGARAHWWHQMGRSAGLGWSDGYHSRTGCPPKNAQGQAGVSWHSFPASGPCPTCTPGVPTPAQHAPVLLQEHTARRPGFTETISAPTSTSQPREAPSWSQPTPVRK